MAKSTSVISNHNLDISSIEALARDISIRLKATIIFGYNKTWFVDEENRLTYDYEFIDLGTIEFPNAKDTYNLIDVNYGSKLYIAENGIEILDSKNFIIDNYYKEDILKDISAIEFELDEIFDNNDTDTIIYIFERSLDLWVTDSLNWNYFQDLFVYSIDNIEFINNWRNENKKWISLFGGNFIFVYSYEESSTSIQNYLEKDNLQDVQAKIFDIFSETLVNISTYFGAKAYLNKPEKEPQYYDEEFNKKHAFAYRKKIDFFPIDIKYPVLFYDNFKDLDDNFNKTNYFDFIYNGNHVIENLKKQRDYQNSIEIHKRKKIKLPNLENYFQLYSCLIAGFKHYKFSYLEFDLIKNQEVFLEREPDNKFDKHAIALYLDHKNEEKTDRIKIGYIGKHENYILSKLLDNHFECKTFLTHISEKELDKGSYNYALKITIFTKKI